MSLLDELKERRVTQYLLTYCAAGWGLLEVVDQLVDRSVIPEIFYRALLTIFVTALPAALVLAWVHGARGKQTATRLQRLLLLAIGVFAVGSATVVVQTSQAEVSPLEDLASTQDPRRVAVLYFDSRGGEDAEFLSAGITESLIDELSAVDALTVVSRNASRSVEDSQDPPRRIARALDVGTLVTGTVAQAGDQIRVDVDMVEGETGRQFESTRLERPRSEIFELQDQLAEQVAFFLRERIGEEIRLIESREGTSSPAAWELVQQAEQAREDHHQLVNENRVQEASNRLQVADSLLARAQELDPDWLRPAVDRGWVAYEQSRLEGFERDAYDRLISTGMEHADRAVSLAPESSEALELRATLQYWRYLLNLGGSTADQQALFEAAEEQLRAAVSADPSNASAWSSLSHLLTNKGEPAAAKLAAQRSYEADAYLRNANLTLWRLFSNSWELEDAVESRRWCEEGLERFPQDFRFSECQLMLFALPGVVPDVEEAWSLYDRYVEDSPPQLRERNRSAGYIWVSLALARGGMADSARAVLRRGRPSVEVDPVRELALYEVIPRLALGDVDEAIRLMSVHFAANPGQVDRYRQMVARGEIPWYFRPLLDEPDFLSLLGLS